MRVVVQRVNEASVTINNEIVSKIEKGLLVLVGVEDEDTQEDINWLCQKITQLRIFDDENGIMNKSIKDINGDLIIVSQFTLHASTKKGNRPSYIKAAKPDIAIPLYESFVSTMENYLGKSVGTGRFGADMKVQLINDGPVTIWIDSKNKEYIFNQSKKNTSMKNIIMLISLVSLHFTNYAQKRIDVKQYIIPEAFTKDVGYVTVDRKEAIEVVNQNNLQEKVYETLLILNQSGVDQDNYTVYYSQLAKIKSIQLRVYNANGDLLKHYKEKDFRDISVADGFSLFTDGRLKTIDINQYSFPLYTIFEYEL